MFQHDSAPCHQATLVTQCLEENILDWPPQSPDSHQAPMGTKLKTSTKNQLWESLQEAWSDIPPGASQFSGSNQCH